MSADPNKSDTTYEEQLSALESRLKKGHDEAMLGEVGLAIRNLLLRNGAGEAHIRQILERQFDHGNLRRESYELVEKLLGKMVAESGRPAPEEAVADEQYTETAVIENPEQVALQATVRDQLQIGTVLRDRYQLKQQVSEGSMGTVYKALDRRLVETGEANTCVAIKILSPRVADNAAALRVLQQETSKGRYLSHPNIVRCMDLDREDGLFFIVMEWLEGRSLASILDDNRGNTLALDMAIDIVAQASRALSYAHQRGVVHGDVKPANIMLTPEGQVKLIDFGVARVRQKENEGKSRFDPDMMRAGTPAYSSMQVLTGEDPVPADDVFSLACLLYRLVAGYRVFGPRNAADAAQEGMEPQQPPDLSDEQWAVLKKALSYSRVTRFDSPKAFMDAFTSKPSRAPKKAAPQAKEQPRPQPRPPKQAPPPIAARPAVADRPIHDTASIQIGSDDTTHISLDTPMRAERDPIMYDQPDQPRRSPWRLAAILVILLASAAVVLREDLAERFGLDGPLASINEIVRSFSTPTETAGAPGESLEAVAAIPDTAVAPAPAAAESSEEILLDPEEGTAEQVSAAAADQSVEEADETQAVVEPDPLPPPIDFSSLPEPDLVLDLEGAAISGQAVTLAVREGNAPAIVDIVRSGDIGVAYDVRLVPGQAGGGAEILEIPDQGLVRFERGQPRVRTSIGMRSNDVREEDRVVTVDVVDPAADSQALAGIRVTLEDDDERAFQASLPVNTIGFLVDEITVREFDPAVQVEVVRYRPDSTAVEVGYTLTDVTATEGQDFFAPGLPVVYFGPGQRSARVLIPLGQDARQEPGETFIIELDVPEPPANSDIFNRIAVMIRDDDS